MQDVSVILRRGEELVHALTNVTCRFDRGEWVGIIGNNGSGKSTLARVVAGLLDISKGHLDTPSEGLRIVLQNPDAQIVGETVWEDLVFGMELAAIPESEMQVKGRRALSQVGLNVPLETPIRQLSGGQRQLLCIASALATDPDWILFDEVTANLNAMARERILNIVRTLHENGLTVLWITQLPEELTHAERVVALEAGRILYDGEIPHFLYHHCDAMGYTPPAVVQLVNALNRRGMVFSELPIHVSDLEHSLSSRLREQLLHKGSVAQVGGDLN